jgi:serine/threonine-protein kinase RsbW
VREPAAVPLGALEADRYFGRVAEQQRCRSLARTVARGAGRSALLAAPAGAGKTELLKQCHLHLFREGEVLPFYYGFPSIGWDVRAFAADFFWQFAAQSLAFRRRDPSLLDRPPAGTLQRGGLHAADAGDALLAETARRLEAPGPGGALSLEVSLLPHRFAAATGLPVLCLLDDAANFAAYQPGGERGWAAEALSSRRAPALFTCTHPDQLEPVLGPGGRPELVAAWELGGLSDEAAGQLLQHQLRTAGLELDEEARTALVRQVGGSPFYLQAVVRALAARAGAGLRAVHRAYAAAVCDGEIGRHLLGRLAAGLPGFVERGTALELLAYCLREEASAPDIGSLGGAMFKSRREVEEAVAGLRRAGIVRVDCARIFVTDDPVFRDFVWALYRREFGRSGPGAVEAALVAEKVRGSRAAAAHRERDALRAGLREVLLAWRGQVVPAPLFKAEAPPERRGDPVEGAPLPGGGPERETVTLPEIVSVACGRVGQGSSLTSLEVDALAWGFSGADGEGELAWVARSLPGGAGGEAQVEEFERSVGAMQAAGDLPASRLVKWAVLGEPLDPAGRRAAARYRMATSTIAQLRALAGLLEVAAAIPAPAPPRPAPATLEFEMTIPMVSDTELVAARALEQLAENLSARPQEIGKIKMALVEACINAFEHSGVPDGRVHLSFAVAGRDLSIRVENRGRAWNAVAFDATARAAVPGARGWGLTLMRELMDEVAFEPREDGVSLVMRKHLETGETEGSERV